jgi:hypothetical protein
MEMSQGLEQGNISTLNAIIHIVDGLSLQD